MFWGFLLGIYALVWWAVWGWSSQGVANTIAALIFVGWCEAALGYLIFRNAVDLFQGVGPLFWIRRHDVVGAKRLAIVRAHEDDEPWRSGIGISIQLGRHGLVVGLCRRTHPSSPEEGLLRALEGRELDETPEEVGMWGL